MKVTVLSDNLQKKLPQINHAISNKTQLPILGNILLETEKDSLQISSTDLEIGIELHVPATIEEEGAITVPAKLFSELISSLPAEKISLSSKDGSLQIQSKKTKSTLQTMPRDEFPALYEEKGEEIFKSPSKELKRNLGLVAFAAGIETTRPALSGVLIKKTTNGFLFVATDGYRLSLKNSSKEETGETLRTMLVPARVVREVVSFKDDADVSLFLSPTNNQVIFSQAETVLIGRLIDAEFPNYQKIIPTDASAKIYFDREELLKAVKVCSIFARETANIIKLSLQKDKIIVSAKTPSLGENTVEVEARLDGEENEIAFNARYLLDVLSTVEESDMAFEMTGPLNSGVFKIANDPSFLHLIMPIRIQG